MANGVVYVGSDNDPMHGKVYALNAKTGKKLWSYTFNIDFVDSSPAVANGVMYIGAGDGTVHAFGLKKGRE